MHFGISIFFYIKIYNLEMFKRSLLFPLLAILVVIVNAFLDPIPSRKSTNDFKPLYGVSYSFEQADWYGLDPREDYKKLLDEVKPDWVRLPFFWDQMVDEGGSLKIDDLKFAIEEAEKRDVKVVIALGAKTPYYPETHFPAEIKDQVKFGQRLTPDHPIVDELLNIDKKVVDELSEYPNISHWQVENEPLLGDPRGISVSVDLVKKEVEVVRNADPKKRPVILNHPAGWYFDRSWLDLLSILEVGDVYSTNAYFKTKGTHLFAAKVSGVELRIPWPDFFVWPVQPWPLLSPPYETFKKKAEERGVGFWVMEMQSEPYIREVKDAEKAVFHFSARDVEKGNSFLKSYGINSIGFWGAHFWQFRAKNGDNTWIDAVRRASDGN